MIDSRTLVVGLAVGSTVAVGLLVGRLLVADPPGPGPRIEYRTPDGWPIPRAELPRWRPSPTRGPRVGPVVFAMVQLAVATGFAWGEAARGGGSRRGGPAGRPPARPRARPRRKWTPEAIWTALKRRKLQPAPVPVRAPGSITARWRVKRSRSV